ncbi:MAG: Crp/Fnr family transcriptional regulator [Clostridiales bacterium]|nr:Crp/Fnr family transcriptional regulator [Clostridiales bacterium]
MKKYLNILKLSKLFAGINEHEIEDVLLCLSAKKRNYRKGEYIFRAGEHISSVALLLEGSVHIQCEDYWGNLSILNKVFKGEVFGEAYAIPGSCAILNNVVAVENSVILFLDFNRIFTVSPSECKFYPALIQNFFALLAEKNRILAQKLGHMSQRTTREKLLSYLSEQSIKSGSPSFDIPFNRQQIADFLSVDRSAMSNELCKMRDDGLLCFNRNHFILT